ncbi:F-box/FBD/LRR-repeat protein At5g56420-like [Silene latifolia]|uniref:F-box/FBD/LRR-repeat protein At5g56420-like n=1 Tax=Silene latifolia TaxID=37657 RepID=UPI003D78055A
MAQSEHLKSSNLIDSDNSETLDRITELPINLVCHILGFLSTKCAVATCVLSKRWKYKWLNVPVLDFTDLPSTNSDGTFHKDYLVCFRNFMNRVLLLHEAPCLEPKQILAKEELVVLKLERLYFDNLSCFVHLPRLRILSLEEVRFDDDAQPEQTEDPLTTILNNCPILEELNIDRCTGFDKLSVESTSLKTLSLLGLRFGVRLSDGLIYFRSSAS